MNYLKLKLTKKQIVGIKKWLEMGKFERDYNCPLNDRDYVKCLPHIFSLCKKLFPKIEICKCPCQAYTKEHVTKIARAILTAYPGESRFKESPSSSASLSDESAR